jgi:hypothetical protein
LLPRHHGSEAGPAHTGPKALDANGALASGVAVQLSGPASEAGLHDEPSLGALLGTDSHFHLMARVHHPRNIARGVVVAIRVKLPGERGHDPLEQEGGSLPALRHLQRAFRHCLRAHAAHARGLRDYMLEAYQAGTDGLHGGVAERMGGAGKDGAAEVTREEHEQTRAVDVAGDDFAPGSADEFDVPH